MAIIKKFRIKSFKENKPFIRLEKISFSYGKRQILDNISFNITKVRFWACLDLME